MNAIGIAEKGIASEVSIPVGAVTLTGDLIVPAGARGIVLFAHGSGSSRRSPRNQFVARVIRNAGAATLLFDLLTLREEEQEKWTRHLRFNIELLAERLVAPPRGSDPGRIPETCASVISARALARRRP